MDKDVVCVHVCMCVYICIHTHTDTRAHTHTMEYYSTIKKNEIMPFAATWMDLEIVILSEVNQTEKDKYRDIAYMRNLKNDTNELIYKKETDTDLENKLMVTVGRDSKGVWD